MFDITTPRAFEKTLNKATWSLSSDRGIQGNSNICSFKVENIGLNFTPEISTQRIKSLTKKRRRQEQCHDKSTTSDWLKKIILVHVQSPLSRLQWFERWMALIQWLVIFLMGNAIPPLNNQVQSNNMKLPRLKF